MAMTSLATFVCTGKHKPCSRACTLSVKNICMTFSLEELKNCRDTALGDIMMLSMHHCMNSCVCCSWEVSACKSASV